MKRFYISVYFLLFITHFLIAQTQTSDSSTVVRSLYIVDVKMANWDKNTGLLYEVKDSSVVVLTGSRLRGLKGQSLAEIAELEASGRPKFEFFLQEYSYSEIQSITIGKRNILLKSFLIGVGVGLLGEIVGLNLPVFDENFILGISAAIGGLSGLFIFKKRYRIKGNYAKFLKAKVKLKDKAVW